MGCFCQGTPRGKREAWSATTRCLHLACVRLNWCARLDRLSMLFNRCRTRAGDPWTSRPPSGYGGPSVRQQWRTTKPTVSAWSVLETGMRLRWFLLRQAVPEKLQRSWRSTSWIQALVRCQRSTWRSSPCTYRVVASPVFTNDLAVQVPQAASRSYGCAPRGGHAISVTVPREAPAPDLFHNRTPTCQRCARCAVSDPR